MVLPDIPIRGWVGLAFGLGGIAFWVVGIFVFDRLAAHYRSEPPGEENSLDDD